MFPCLEGGHKRGVDGIHIYSDLNMYIDRVRVGSACTDDGVEWVGDGSLGIDGSRGVVS